jgi:hypothetical protein
VEADTHRSRAPAGPTDVSCERAREFAQRSCTNVAQKGRLRDRSGQIYVGIFLMDGSRQPAIGQSDRSIKLHETGRRSRPVSRVLSRTTIHLRYASPRTCSDLPGSTCGPHARPRSEDPTACSPIWSCSGRGLPCRRVLPPARCALTAPFHPYRPAPKGGGWRFAFCCTFRGLTPPRCYLAPCPGSPDFPPRLRAAVVWPTPRRDGAGVHAKAQAVIRGVWAWPG